MSDKSVEENFLDLLKTPQSIFGANRDNFKDLCELRVWIKFLMFFSYKVSQLIMGKIGAEVKTWIINLNSQVFITKKHGKFKTVSNFLYFLC